jgi:hypothetical protein
MKTRELQADCACFFRHAAVSHAARPLGNHCVQLAYLSGP